MGLKAIMKVLMSSGEAKLIASTDRFTQTITLESKLLNHIRRYRQLTPIATEAGGQLFGKVEGGQVRLIVATGPYAGDERSRYHYRSNPDAAQQAIEQQDRAGLLYLGEWHTHAEDRPSPSRSDDDAMNRLIKNSRTNTNGLVMVIAGRLPGPEGICVMTVATDSRIAWKVAELHTNNSY